jgi:hypothetical protein
MVYESGCIGDKLQINLIRKVWLVSFGNQERGPIMGEVTPRPLQKDDEPILKTTQVHEVNYPPQVPGQGTD